MAASAENFFDSIEAVENTFSQHGYVTDRVLATAVFLSLKLGKPLFLEGEPGVGKTEIAKVLNAVLGGELIRLQCYEGLDAHTALYEWNYPRQMLELRLQEARGTEREQIGRNIFSEEFLLKRPLLRALQSEGDAPPVLLIDEIDRSDEEFEAFLLEVLSDYQITIPEIGTVRAAVRPVVVLTSNRTRELHDALKRRCLFHWIDYPDMAKELRIVQSRVPGIAPRLAAQICRFMELVRDREIYKRPGVAETIDWAHALLALGIDDLTPEAADATLGCILKFKGDIDALREDGFEDTVRRAQMPGHDLPDRD